MSVSDNKDSKVFTKDNIDRYLLELAKEYKRLAGKKMPAEIILVGGAAVVELYRFRSMTTDIDAVIQASSAMKEAINNLEERFGLSRGWINSDFQKTASFSRNLVRCSVYYRTFAQILSVRVVKAEYLLAMKLRSFRKYKNDVSDIVGILTAHKEMGDPLTADRIDHAVTELYGSWEGISQEAAEYIKARLERDDYAELFEETKKLEAETKEDLIMLEEKYPSLTNEDNVAEIIKALQKKRAELSPDSMSDQSDRRNDR